jgi:Tfp pilus assembly protein PilF
MKKQYKPKPTGVHPLIANMVDIPTKLKRAFDFHNKGNLLEASNIYKDVLKQDPKNFSAWLYLGSAEADLQHWQSAYECLSKALEVQPEEPNALNMRANVLRDCGKYDLALIDATKAVNKAPDSFDVNVNLSAIHFCLNDFDTSLTFAKKGAELKPENPDGFLNWGNSLKEMGDVEGALEKFKHCVELKPTHHGAWSNIATCYKDMYELDLSIENYTTAIGYAPADAQLYYNRALVKLMNGDYEGGWRDHEFRWSYKGFNTLRLGDVVNSWKGDMDLTGKEIMVWYEQGLGDTIQFSRYCKLLKDRGAKVKLWVQKPLESVMKTLPFVDNVITEQGEKTWDYTISLMALPFELGTTVDTIPNFGPYIIADAEKSAAWAERLGEKTKPRVGIVWSGGLRIDQPNLWTTNQRRNTKLHLFQKFKDLDVEFYSLQKGNPGEQELKLFEKTDWGGPKIHNYVDELHDFSDTAALIDNLDLVISVDTSTAHLAAAMGKPVWIMNRWDTCWRWFLNREDSPWYDSVRLFRQPAPGDWESVIDQVYTELSKFK